MAKNTCTLFVRDMKILGRVGVFAPEKQRKTRLCINLEIGLKRKGGKGETIDDLISYGDMAGVIRRVVDARHYDLIETLADAILDEMGKDKRARSMRLTIDKIDAYTPKKGVLDGVTSIGVVMERKR